MFVGKNAAPNLFLLTLDMVGVVAIDILFTFHKLWSDKILIGSVLSCGDYSLAPVNTNNFDSNYLCSIYFRFFLFYGIHINTNYALFATRVVRRPNLFYHFKFIRSILLCAIHINKRLKFKLYNTMRVLPNKCSFITRIKVKNGPVRYEFWKMSISFNFQSCNF